MYQEHQQMEHSSLPPAFAKNSARCITVLQELQTLLGSDATLDDVIQVVQNAADEFGSQAQLETAIQSLVERNLEQQIAMRKQRKVIL